MTSSEKQSNGNTSVSPSNHSITVFALAIIGVQIMVALASYPFLPEQVPTHWNMAGEINGYTAKSLFAPLFPLLSLGIYILIRVLVVLGPKLGSSNQASNGKIANLTSTATLLLFLVVQLMCIAAALHIPVDVSFVTSLLISALMIFLGNYLGKIQRNFWIGIRTPWTLASETVWERTHRMGGWLFVLAGILGLLITFIPGVNEFGVIALLLAVAAITTIYSYIVYERLKRSGKDPVSPPFTNKQ